MRLSRPVIACYLAAGVFAAALSVSFAAHAGQEHSAHSAAVPVAQNARDQAVQHTQALMALQKQWAGAAGNEKSRALEQLLTRAQARQQFLLALAETSPADVLRVAIPDEQQRGMPEEVLAFIEQKIELDGELEVGYEDYEDGSHKLRQFVHTSLGERFELHFIDHSTALEHGWHINSHGLLFSPSTEVNASRLDGVVVLDKSAGQETMTAGDDGSTAGSVMAAAGGAFGEQQTLVMLVNFQDDPGNMPWSKEDVSAQVFGEVSRLYEEMSEGQTWLSGDVAGWFTVPVNSTTCDYWSIEREAKAAASATGIDTSQYARFIYAFPTNSGCGWGGYGTVGGSPSSAWMNGSVMRLFTTTHELGHNLRLQHSGALECGSDIIGENCSVMAYGDFIDVMGDPNPGHFNAFQKQRLGWLAEAQGNIVQAVNGGTFILESYAAEQGAYPKAVKVPKGVDPVTGSQSWYFIEYRQATGADRFLADNPNTQNGLVIRTAHDGNSGSSRLLDMNPNSTSYTFQDWIDPALEAGNRFTDDGAGISISTDWVNGNEAQVTVSVDGQGCVEAAPSVVVTPEQPDWVAAGTTVEVVVTVSSHDSAVCPGRNVELDAIVPAGWMSHFINSSLMLAPGDSADTTLSLTSSADAADGFYDIGIRASAGSEITAAQMVYVVDNATVVANQAPVAQNDSAATAFEAAVTIDVLSNDADPDGDAIWVTALSNASGSAVINPDGSITYTPAVGFSGNDSFGYTITDENGAEASATVSIDVSARPNRAPVTQPDSAEADRHGVVIIDVMANDLDPDGDALQLVAVTQGSKGNVSINPDGTLTYVPAKSFKNADSFSYTISDGELNSTAKVSIALAGSGGDTSGGKGKGPNK